MISTIAPSLGGSVREVWIAWKQLQEGCGPSGRRVPVGRIVGMGEFAWSADGKLQRIVGPMQMKDVTASEENEVADALAKGQLQIVLRGTWGVYADRRSDTEVVHQATGRSLPQDVDGPAPGM